MSINQRNREISEILTDATPNWTPTVGQSRLARVEDTAILYYFNKSNVWVRIDLSTSTANLGYSLVSNLTEFDALVSASTPGPWIIMDDFTLTADRAIPTGVILKFNGGVISGAFTLTGNKTRIDADLTQVFDDSVILAGDWSVKEFYPQWFGAKGDGVTDDTTAFTAIKNSVSIKSVYIPNGAYVISSQVAFTQEIKIHGNRNLSILESTGSNVSMFDFSAKALVENLSFSSEGQTDTFITGTSITGGITIRNNDFDWANGSGANGMNTGNGIDIDTTSDILIEGNSFKNGWRDKNYDATGWDTNGSNMLRDINIANSAVSNKTVSILNNNFYDSGVAISSANCNDLLITGNRIELTGDTAIFDRCTGGFSYNKNISNNILKDIGKGGIKILDTNNNSGAGGERAICSCNIIENWGMKLATQAIFSGNGFNGSYSYDSVNRNRDLIISNNTLIETSTSSCHQTFALYNMDDVIIDGNVIRLNDTTSDVDSMGDFSRFIYSNNKYKANGTISFGYGFLNAHVTGNTFDIYSNIRITGTSPSNTEEPLLFLFIFSNNTVRTRDITTTSRVSYGLRVFNNTGYGTYNIDGNIFHTSIARVDSSEATGIGLFNPNPDNSYYSVDNNFIIFTDGSDTQKTIGGSLLNPLYYCGLKGIATIDESTGLIRYRIGNGSAYRAVSKTLTAD